MSPLERSARILMAVGLGMMVFNLIFPEAHFPGFPLSVLAALLVPGYDWLRGRNARDDRAIIAEQLASLLELGASLPEAVRTLAIHSSTLSRPFLALPRVADRLLQGDSPGEAFGPDFPPLWRELLQGEDLPRAFRRLAEAEAEVVELPVSFVLRVVLQVPFILWAISVFVPLFIPMTEALLPGSGSLPLLADLSRALGLALLAALPLSLSSRVRQAARVGISRLPGFWSLTRLQEQARFCQAGAAALECGASLPRALEVARDATLHPAYRKLKLGATLRETLRPDLFEPRLRWLLEQGERSETLADGLELGAVFLREEFRYRNRRFGARLDTATLLALGALSGWLAVEITLRLQSLMLIPLGDL